MRTRNRIRSVVAMAAVFLMLLPGMALASDVAVVVVDITAPTNSVTLAPGGSGSITINMSVSGNQEGTATFEVYRDWTLSGGTFVGSNPKEFTVAPRSGGDPATTFSTTGTVSVAAGQAAGSFTLAVGAFDITNSNTSGGKLAAGAKSDYQVTVSAPTKAATTVSAVGGSGTYGGTATLTATLKAGTSAVSGKTINFSLGGSPAGSSQTNSLGVATLNNVSLDGYNAGAHTAAVSASFTEDATHLGNTAAGGLTVDKAPSTTTVFCDAGPFSYTGAAVTPCSASATGAGGLNQPLSVTYEDNVDVGTATASASYAGGDNHLPSSDSKTFSISKATPEISINWENSTYDGNSNAASASVTGVGGANLGSASLSYYSGTTPNGTPLAGAPTNAGTYTVKADYAETANYNNASTTKTITISKAATTTTVTCDAGPFSYNGFAHEPCSARVTGAGGLDQAVPVSYENNVDAGSATANASYGGAANYEPSSGSKTFRIDKAATQTVVTCDSGPFVYTGSAFTPCSASVTGPGLNQALTVNYSNNTNPGTATAGAAYTDTTNYLGSSDSKTFAITAWTLSKFGNPVSADPSWNVMKGGRTVPLKFTVLAGTTALTNTSAVKSFKAFTTSCTTGSGELDFLTQEETSTGNTSLRYDSTEGQFIQNWKTPTVSKDTCYRVEIETQDGSKTQAFFRLTK